VSGEAEAVGGAVTAALAANEVEGQAGRPGPAAGRASCLNCGATLGGAYCHACGQRAHLHRSLWHVAEEILHGVLHFDAKMWRTLPLLVARPGVLTRRYIDGQRARYVSPMALFLFSIFLMFLAFSQTGVVNIGLPAEGSAELAQARLELKEAVWDARHELASRERDLAQARRASSGVEEAVREVEVAREALKVAQAAWAAVERPASGALTAAEVAARAARAAAAPGSAPAASAASKPAAATGDSWGERFKANPELVFYKLKNTAYKFSFMLVPISLPFLWLLFIRRPGVTAYDHAVFSLYSLSFMSLLVILLLLLSLTPLDALALLLVGVAPVHLVLQMRDTYGIGTRWAMAGYSIGLLGAAGMSFALFVAFVVWMGMH
jgi:hypothetical protein